MCIFILQTTLLEAEESLPHLITCGVGEADPETKIIAPETEKEVGPETKEEIDLGIEEVDPERGGEIDHEKEGEVDQGAGADLMRGHLDTIVATLERGKDPVAKKNKQGRVFIYKRVLTMFSEIFCSETTSQSQQTSQKGDHNR